MTTERLTASKVASLDTIQVFIAFNSDLNHYEPLLFKDFGNIDIMKAAEKDSPFSTIWDRNIKNDIDSHVLNLDTSNKYKIMEEFAIFLEKMISIKVF